MERLTGAHLNPVVAAAGLWVKWSTADYSGWVKVFVGPGSIWFGPAKKQIASRYLDRFAGFGLPKQLLTSDDNRADETDPDRRLGPKMTGPDSESDPLPFARACGVQVAHALMASREIAVIN